jgi:hypothetical protein
MARLGDEVLTENIFLNRRSGVGDLSRRRSLDKLGKRQMETPQLAWVA